TQPAIGQDTNGVETVVVPISGAAACCLTHLTKIPGLVVALTLRPSSGAVTTTQVTTVQGSVTTVQGPSTGIDPAQFYLAIAVAAVFVIATGALAIRSRKHAAPA